MPAFFFIELESLIKYLNDINAKALIMSRCSIISIHVLALFVLTAKNREIHFINQLHSLFMSLTHTFMLPVY